MQGVEGKRVAALDRRRIRGDRAGRAAAGTRRGRRDRDDRRHRRTGASAHSRKTRTRRRAEPAGRRARRRLHRRRFRRAADSGRNFAGPNSHRSRGTALRARVRHGQEADVLDRPRRASSDFLADRARAADHRRRIRSPTTFAMPAASIAISRPLRIRIGSRRAAARTSLQFNRAMLEKLATPHRPTLA